MRRLAIAAALVALAGTAAAVTAMPPQSNADPSKTDQSKPAQSRADRRAERELADALKDRVAGEPVDCISNVGLSGPQIIDKRTLLYRSGSRVWRASFLGGECPGIHPLDTLVVVLNGPQLCRLDRVRSVTPGMSIPSAICTFDKFTPYTKAK